MSSLTAPAAPALGSRFTSHATGRTWHVDHTSAEGLICLAEEYYGPDCVHRSYVTGDELAADYEFIGCDHHAACCTTHGTHTTPHLGCILR